MKRALYLLSIVSIIFAACKKEDEVVTPTLVNGCNDLIATNYNEIATVDDGSCIYSGCMDSTATNYNKLATVDDGSCIYSGCMDAIATNYDATATNDDGLVFTQF